VLYAVRDLLILFALGLGQRAERAELGAALWLALLYWLLPAILETSGLVQAAALLRPPLWDKPGMASLALGAHVAVSAAWAWRRYARAVPPRLLPGTADPG